MDIKTNGYDSLVESVMKDCNEGEGCFNANGCIKAQYKHEDGHCYRNIKCFHTYCDKFKWVIDRAQHYADKTGIDKNELLDAWEKQRSYWYMNYYQDCNQPEIKDDNVKLFDTIDELMKSINNKGFRCPSCKGISKNPYVCDTGLEMSKGKICDWKAYGLLGTLGKGATVFVKEKLRIETIFMPVAWESIEVLK